MADADRLANKSIDKAAQQMLRITEQKGVETIWDRYEAQTPVCEFGKMGICCRICDIGPCRISPFEDGPKRRAAVPTPTRLPHATSPARSPPARPPTRITAATSAMHCC